MISLDVIEQEIRELEARGETTYALCERLAWLYICRDHLVPEERKAGKLSGSEFLETASGVPYSALMGVIDEHMSAMKLLHGREYESVLAKIRALKG